MPAPHCDSASRLYRRGTTGQIVRIDDCGDIARNRESSRYDARDFRPAVGLPMAARLNRVFQQNKAGPVARLENRRWLLRVDNGLSRLEKAAAHFVYVPILSVRSRLNCYT